MEVCQEHIDFWCCRRAAQKLHNQRLEQSARSEVKQIVRLLIAEFGAEKIILFGSLAKGSFRVGSDIDLAVEGLPADRLFSALGAVNRLSRAWIDLKPLEDLEPHFKNRILNTGEVLYARDLKRCLTGNGE
ncbi:nucleotidyltransferase family protein [Desulfobacca acetoxidans]